MSMSSRFPTDDKRLVFNGLVSFLLHLSLRDLNARTGIDKANAATAQHPIKALGVYKVPIRLHADVKPEIRVWVIKQ